MCRAQIQYVVASMNQIVMDAKMSNKRNIEEEFKGSLRSFFLVCQIFCAAPISRAQSYASKSRVKILTRAHFAYGIIIYVFFLFALYLRIKSAAHSVGLMRSILFLFEVATGMIELLLVVISCQYQKKQFAIFFKRLISIDLNLQKCGIQPNFDPLRKYLNRSMIVYAIFFTLTAISEFILEKGNFENFAIGYTIFIIPNIVSTLALTQYSTVLFCIRGKLRSINAVLRLLVTSSNFDEDCQVAMSVLSISIGKLETEKVLNILRRQHAELSRLMEQLNECFGVLIVLIILSAYINLSIEFFLLYKFIMDFDGTYAWDILLSVLWLVLQAAKILLVLHPISDACEERKLSGNLLFDINFHRSDLNVALELKTFSDQILHTPPPTACRIIYLDLKIASAMVGVITTYMIILIQFDGSKNNLSKAHCNCT